MSEASEDQRKALKQMGEAERFLRKMSGSRRSMKAGLTFPVGRIATRLRLGNYADRLSKAAPVYLAAVLEYICSEVLEVIVNEAWYAKPHTKDDKKRIISPRLLMVCVCVNWCL